ncbi:monocarboxylate transporter 14 [Dermacentor andersoni]|uniref:monocarboxylate transporter 14 n=1 Tax=Dermacentor andersoni TaxID=34620 RepID=UPI0021552F14|nr:monocarboxylate transporter 13-like [Dermacentor andersoni]XP_050042908.1 monocarboxylate transporter 13-like [Dermacentor andersoni]XP_054931827.1 monocarboxylate transporter 13-like [Dermacentor andersoni]
MGEQKSTNGRGSDHRMAANGAVTVASTPQTTTTTDGGQHLSAASATALAPPPDGGWGWMVVFSSFMIHVIADGVTYTFGIFYLEFLKHFQESKGKTAWIASIMVGTTFCIGPVASGLTTKYGCRAVTIAGSLLATVGLVVSVVAPNVTYLFFTIGLCTGAGFGLMYLPAIVSVTTYFEKRRAFATGIAVCGSGFGTFALAPFIEWLVHVYGWQGALLCTAGMVLNCCVFGALLRPLPQPAVAAQAPPAAHGTYDKPAIREINGNAYHDVEGVPRRNGGLSSCSASRELSLSTGTIAALQAADGVEQQSDGRRNRRPRSALFARAGGGGVTLPLLKLEDEKTSMSCVHIAGSSPPSPTGPSAPALHPRSLLVRKDIFYSGSMQNLPPEYRASSSFLSRDMSLSVTSLRTIKSVTVPTSDERSRIQRFFCSSEMEAALHEMINFTLLKSPVFLLFATSNFFTSVGFNVPYVYTKDRAVEDLRMPEETGSLLLSCIGLSNTLGRVVLGYLSDKSCVNRLWLYNVNLTLCGLATAFSYAAQSAVSMAVYCVIFGATSGAFVSLTSVILVDILGLERLTNAFGLLLLFEGVACLVGPPVTGWLYDYTGSYDPGFFLSGAMIAFGGVMLFLIPCTQRCEGQEEKPVAGTTTTTTTTTTTSGTAKSGSSSFREETTDSSLGHTVTLSSSLNGHGPHNV